MNGNHEDSFLVQTFRAGEHELANLLGKKIAREIFEHWPEIIALVKELRVYVEDLISLFGPQLGTALYNLWQKLKNMVESAVRRVTEHRQNPG